MKKSMIAAAVVATAALAGSASASFFTITGGGASTGGSVGFSFSGQLGAGNNTSTGVAASSTFTGAGEVGMLNADVTTIATTLSNSVAGAGQNGSLTWFGFHNGASSATPGALGYFGVMFIGNGSSFTLTVNNSVPPAAAVYESLSAASFGSLSSGTFSVNLGATTAGTTYMWIFSGIAVGSTIGGNALAADGNMSVRYLESSSGSTWTVAASGTGASAGLNAATYSIPVPAPALLAGAGLIGAAAIRRRMAKKA